MTCQECGESADELISVKVGRKRLRLCKECAEIRQQEDDIAAEAEGVMGNLMEYKGG